MAGSVNRSDAERCRSCTHWKPWFTGEEWGVRSLADAPIDVQRDILAKVKPYLDKDGCKRPDVDDLRQMGFPTNHRLVAPDWPLWGECLLTELHTDGSRRPSIALAQDGSDYCAILQCRADFGCVQWERQE